MLKIDSVRATYENNTVLNDLSYTFEDKNKYALIGTSGIGKTTLLNILCGIRKADGGTVISDYSSPSYIFKDPRLFPWMTALENVELVYNDKERAKDILLSLLKDTNALKNFPNELSGGMKQRVSIARALAYDGDIVFIRSQNAVDNGEIAAVIINDEATLKRVYYYPEQQKLILTPENPKYAPLVYVGGELESIKIIGKAVAFQSTVV